MIERKDVISDSGNIHDKEIVFKQYINCQQWIEMTR